jgi:DNA-binding transcriptional LysR family regulator
MELRHLRYFVRVAEALSFRAAAKTLRVSAPALSRQIRDLEEELGVRLLDRNTQIVRLTQCGRVFLPEARDILAQVTRAAEFAREAHRGARGCLRVGTIGRRLAQFLPDCLADFQRRYPEAQVELVELDYAEQIHALRTGTLDIGFMPAHVVPPLGTGFRQETILSVPIFAMVGAKHPLAPTARLTLARLATERLLFLGKNKASMSADYARGLFAARNLQPREVREVNGFQILITMVAAGQGVSLMGFEPNLPGASGVVLRPLKDRGNDLRLEFCAIYPTYGRDPNRLAESFWLTLREVASSRRRSA